MLSRQLYDLKKNVRSRISPRRVGGSIGIIKVSQVFIRCGIFHAKKFRNIAAKIAVISKREMKINVRIYIGNIN